MHGIFVVETEEFVFVQFPLQTTLFQSVLDAMAHIEIEPFGTSALNLGFFLFVFDEVSVFVHQQIIRFIFSFDATAGHDRPHFVIEVRARLEALARLPE